jgi:hypothetical protein
VSKKGFKFSNAVYQKASEGGAKAARNELNYNINRPGDDGREEQNGQRELFDSQGSVDKIDFLDRMDAVEKSLTDVKSETYYYSVLLAPGEGKNDVDKEEYTRDVMFKLEQAHGISRGGQMEWAGVVHDNQSDHDHIHVVMVTDRVLSKPVTAKIHRDFAPKSWEQAKENVRVFENPERDSKDSNRESKIERESIKDRDERGR